MLDKIGPSSSPSEVSEQMKIATIVENIVESASTITNTTIQLSTVKDDTPYEFDIVRRGNLAGIVFVNGKVQTI